MLISALLYLAVMVSTKWISTEVSMDSQCNSTDIVIQYPDLANTCVSNDFDTCKKYPYKESYFKEVCLNDTTLELPDLIKNETWFETKDFFDDECSGTVGRVKYVKENSCIIISESVYQKFECSKEGVEVLTCSNSNCTSCDNPERLTLNHCKANEYGPLKSSIVKCLKNGIDMAKLDHEQDAQKPNNTWIAPVVAGFMLTILISGVMAYYISQKRTTYDELP